MLQWMEAEILFFTAADVGPAIPVLIEHGFDVELLYDRIDPCSNAFWIRVTVISKLAPLPFFDWVATLAESLNAQVEEAGPVADDGLVGRVLN